MQIITLILRYEFYGMFTDGVTALHSLIRWGRGWIRRMFFPHAAVNMRYIVCICEINLIR